MKRVPIFFVLAAALSAFAGTAVAEVGVSVSIGQPGFYGRLDIGDFPPPPLIYPQPLIIERAGPGVAYAPIYLRVPPGHAKHWSKHCYRYGACGRPVYFVQDRWYNDVYAPRYRELRGHPRHHHDERRHDDRYGPGERGYGPGHPPGPPGPRPGYGPGYGPGPGFGPGHPPGRP